ncbi:hypothetical protein MNEG_3872, partial [Monoraphidium neglectum]
LDRAFQAVASSRDGVLPDDEIDHLVAALDEPSLEEPLRELRRQRLRKAARTAGDGGADYTPLPRDESALGEESQAQQEHGGNTEQRAGSGAREREGWKQQQQQQQQQPSGVGTGFGDGASSRSSGSGGGCSVGPSAAVEPSRMQHPPAPAV